MPMNFEIVDEYRDSFIIWEGGTLSQPSSEPDTFVVRSLENCGLIELSGFNMSFCDKAVEFLPNKKQVELLKVLLNEEIFVCDEGWSYVEGEPSEFTVMFTLTMRQKKVWNDILNSLGIKELAGFRNRNMSSQCYLYIIIPKSLSI